MDGMANLTAAPPSWEFIPEKSLNSSIGSIRWPMTTITPDRGTEFARSYSAAANLPVRRSDQGEGHETGLMDSARLAGSGALPASSGSQLWRCLSGAGLSGEQ